MSPLSSLTAFYSWVAFIASLCFSFTDRTIEGAVCLVAFMLLQAIASFEMEVTERLDTYLSGQPRKEESQPSAD